MASDEIMKRDVRSFIVGREPSIDRRFRPRPERQVRLFNDINEEVDSVELEDESNFDSTENLGSSEPTGETDTFPNSSTNDSTTKEGVSVFLRLRPINPESSAYETRGKTFVVKAPIESVSTSNNKNAIEKHFGFTDIFDRDISQSSVYENCVRSKIEAEESFTFLTYGTSGSGKTYTLLGNDNQPGMIPRALEQIFKLYEKKIYPQPSLQLIKGRVTLIEDKELLPHIELRKRMLSNCKQNPEMEKTRMKIYEDHDFGVHANEDVSVMIWVSFVEIYNENVYDLLEAPPTTVTTTIAQPPRKTHKIVGNDGKVFIKGLTSVYVKTAEEALHLLRHGLQHVNYAATSINANSSRSHCIFQIDVIKFFRSGLFSEASYKFCDLAGSERVNKTGNFGTRLKESQRINTSLLVLGRCIDAANSKSKGNNDLIPFRESKLTMLLQAALLGKEKLTMIVNVMPTEKYYDENINVLGFASIAKNIVFKQPVVKPQRSRYSFLFEYSHTNENENSTQIQTLLEENIFLRSEVSRLTDCIEELKQKHLVELFNQERELRTTLVNAREQYGEQMKKQFEERLNLEMRNLQRAHDAKIKSMIRKHEWEMEDLREELENNNDNENKRRTLD